ncbi:MAG TPA: CPBP family intramembrane glutamic endopeptidase [Xanthomonadales bacterium]|nr:CPBP family intramembrane glutamic endopeptidase [Xanthomonadales bacterium]
MHDATRSSFAGDSLRAHALLFENPLRPTHDAAAGVRMLVAFVLVAVVALYALRATMPLVAPIAKLSFVALLTLLFLVVHRWYVRVPFAAIGLRGRGQWTRREALYLVQVGVLASIAFVVIFRRHFERLWTFGPLDFLVIVATGLAWGAVQEFLYRGWLQTELTRRWGPWAGLLVANVLFTLGPLHVNYANLGAIDPGLIAAIFAIGLLFGLIYQRSGNLWIPAVLHGLWPLNMS